MGNFEVFTRTFAEHYISFDLRHVDWNRVVAEQRTKINSQTTPAQLFDILQGMIRPLSDIHTGIEAPKLKRAFDAPLRAGTDRVVHGSIGKFEKAGRRDLAAVTDRIYLRGPVRAYCRGQWLYGVADGDIGYLRILEFGDYARYGGYEGNLRALNLALDRMLADHTLRALIIDTRLSFGGDDRLGLAIAARLTGHEYPAYAIQARSDGGDATKFTELQRVMVKPGKQPLFSGPIVELTGPITMSAAETFTEALMERTPRVMRIGENTQGVFCDSLDRHLPNGWSFSLPNAVYRTSEGKAYDVEGIPPDVTVPVFADDDIAAGRDPAMAAAMKLLKK
jgi:C-terminal processing protease CtpA/Prc